MADLKSPRDRFMNDPEYHHLVCTLENLIESARFTPSELREACILASINYEMRHVRSAMIDPRLGDALQVLDEFTGGKRRRG